MYVLDGVRNVDGDMTRSWYRKTVDASGKECAREEYARALEVQYVDVYASRFVPDKWKKVCDYVNVTFSGACLTLLKRAT